AGMGAGAAEIEASERHSVLGPPRRWPEEEELVRRELSMEDVPARQADHLFQVPGAEHLPLKDDLPEIRNVPLDRLEDRRSECLAPFLPSPFTQRVRCVLDEARHDVFARRREG